ncbi:LysR family transcriptional regulator [Mesorhizobium sp. M1405]|uniref:LysR family transcriptional regulator n=1 Tax=Mesorhizobium sp. M1405 TaxID=2957098 RepID=UPI003337D83D
MDHRHYDLPSLTALEVFEASARHLSFKLAAWELNLTSGEISRQIKAIEDELGVPLFVTPGTSVTLTSAGRDLYSVLASSFSKASDAFKTIRRGGDPECHDCLHRCVHVDVADAVCCAFGHSMVISRSAIDSSRAEASCASAMAAAQA